MPGLLGVWTVPPPQPALKPTAAISTIAPSSVVHRRRRTGITRNSSPAIATPPPIGSSPSRGFCIAPVVAAVVFTVNVAVADVLDPEVAVNVLKEQVGGSFSVVGDTVQLSETPLAASPLPSVAVMVDVPLPPGVAIEIDPLLLRLIVGAGAVTVTETTVGVGVATPVALAETDTMYAPAVVVDVEVTVSSAVAGAEPVIETGVTTEQVGTLVPVVGVTAQLSATEPVNPPAGVTEIVDVPEPPAAGSVMDPLLLSAMVGVTAAAFTVSGTVVVAVVTPAAVPVTVTV